MTTAKHTSSYKIGTVVDVDPTTVLMERNVREAKPDTALVKSVAQLGVLEPATAVLTKDHQLLIRHGHRRTLAAIEAHQPLRVYIAGTDATTKDAEVARIIEQRDENTHRVGLSPADEVGVVEQLAAFGLTAAQITKQARIKRSAVDAAVQVSESKLARAAADRYDNLTLDQLAVVAEFEDDAETVKALIVAASKGQFDHAAQQARDARTAAAMRDEVENALTEAAVTVVERPEYDDTQTMRLDRLRVSDTDRTLLSDTDHSGCPGHVAWIAQGWAWIDADGQHVEFPDEPIEDDDEAWEKYDAQVEALKAAARRMLVPSPAYGCTGWRKHGHTDAYSHTSTAKLKAEDMSAEEREAAKTARKLVIENNKAWVAAEEVRRTWIADNLAKAKTPPKGAAAFIAATLCTDPHMIGDGNDLAATWLGKKKNKGYGRTDLTPAKSTTEARALVTVLVQVLADYETAQTGRSWREDGTATGTGRYLRFLARCGYNLAEVEKYAISSKTA